ncbi:MAG: SBBP repeat-containing protein [Bacteroidia bacterium]|nr:SBBP repeat-containing protein [Bacteroidia bacterium]
MKNSALLIAVICFLSCISNAQTPDWLWAKSAGGTKSDFANSVSVDALGYKYIAGSFNSPTITFGSFTLVNADNTGYSDDIFLVKYDVSGNVIWAKNTNGLNAGEANSVAVDASGNIYLTGSFSSPDITFGSTVLTNSGNGSPDIFLAKYNSNGNVLWAKSAGGSGDDISYSVAVDSSGNAYVAGVFSSSSIIFGSDTLTNENNSDDDIFLTKYDFAGNVLWAKSFGGSSMDQTTSVAVDVSGNIYVAGGFTSSTISFGPDTLTNAGYYDIFLAKFDANGIVLWAKSAGGTDGDFAGSVEADTSGNIYIYGEFYSKTIIFGSDTLTNIDSTCITTDIFLTKYDPYGNVLWAKSAGGSGNDLACSVAVDVTGNTYLAGAIANTIIIGPDTLINEGGSDIFLAKFNINGIDLWAKRAGGIDNDLARSVAVDVTGNVYLTGYFQSPVIPFSSTTLINSDNSGFSADIFIAKLGTSSGINELGNSIDVTVFPNPAGNFIETETPPHSVINIFNIEGQLIRTIQANNTKSTVDISALTAGMYIIKVVTVKGIAVRKFVKQ